MKTYYVRTQMPLMVITEYMVTAESEEAALWKALEGHHEAETFIGHEWMEDSVEEVISVEEEIN